MPQNITYAELMAPLLTDYTGTISTLHNTARVALGLYQRIAILLFPIAVGSTLDADIYLATAASGGTSKKIASITQLSGSDDAVAPIIVDVMNEVAGNPNAGTGRNYDYIYVALTPSGNASVIVSILGADARSLPTDQTLWTEAVHVP
jgi:hypothetical protein